MVLTLFDDDIFDPYAFVDEDDTADGFDEVEHLKQMVREYEED